MKCLALILVLAAFALYSVSANNLYKSWKLFKNKFGKSYESTKEEQKRLRIFTKNIGYINEHNARFQRGQETYELGINAFADLTFAEFSKKYLGASPKPIHGAIPHEVDSSEEIPIVFNEWVENEWLTNIKNQGSCGSCWAFAAVSSIEFAYTQETGYVVEFSEQNMLDCSWLEGSRGCSGGWPPDGYDSVNRTGGLMLAADYPYKGKDSLICKVNKTKVMVTTTDYVSVEGDENLKSAITQNNVAIAMEVEKSFQLYKSGVYSTNSCKNTSSALNHAVNAVGFGIFKPEGSDSTNQYWQIRNSWGEKWGEKGYARIEFGKCGVGKIGFYPIIKVIKDVDNPEAFAALESLGPSETSETSETDETSDTSDTSETLETAEL